MILRDLNVTCVCNSHESSASEEEDYESNKKPFGHKKNSILVSGSTVTCGSIIDLYNESS